MLTEALTAATPKHKIPDDADLVFSPSAAAQV